MTNRYDLLLRRICRECRIASPDSFHHAELGRVALQPPPADTTETEAASALTQQIWLPLYQCYHTGDPTQAFGEPMLDLTPIVSREDPDFGRRLREMNHDPGRYESGWRVESIEADRIRVTKAGVTLVASRNEIRAEDGIHPGLDVLVRFPGHFPYMVPGYFLAVGRDGIPHRPQTRVVRLYFNVSAAGALKLLSRLTQLLPDRCPSYAFKTLNNPRAYTRRDAAVLYLENAQYLMASDALRALCGDLKEFFASPTPGFAKRLMPGVALAEELDHPDSTRVSFGQHRSLLVAQGLAQAFLAGQDSVEGRYRAVVKEFRTSGFDPACPYLNAGSLDHYDSFAPDPSSERDP